MTVCAEQIVEADTFRSVLSVVAESFQDFSQRFHAFPQVRPSTVVLEPGHCAASGFLPKRICIVADHPPVASDRIQIHRSQKLTPYTVMGLVVMPHHLIAAADT